MSIDWVHAWPSIIAAFLASVVEFVEALTVVLAVGAVRGWRGALIGSGAALVVLLAIVAIAGPALTRIPLEGVQLVVGTLLLLFGMRWLRKAILRSAGVIPRHDENAAYAAQSQSLRHPPRGHVRGADSVHGADGTHGTGSTGAARLDTVAVAAAFKITILEGLEVVFIVIAVGAGGVGLLIPASVGALTALVAVMLGWIVHRPLAAIPENALKFAVGVLLTAFGTFWIGAGIGVAWPGQDWSIPGLTAAYLLIALLARAGCRFRAAGQANAVHR